LVVLIGRNVVAFTFDALACLIVTYLQTAQLVAYFITCKHYLVSIYLNIHDCVFMLDNLQVLLAQVKLVVMVQTILQLAWYVLIGDVLTLEVKWALVLLLAFAAHPLGYLLVLGDIWCLILS
jgi:hypothetical protein